MADREVLAMPANAPQPVTWFLVSYYPTDADGQVASVVGVQFKTYEAAVTAARAYVATVGVAYIQRVEGSVVYPLFAPTPY